MSVEQNKALVCRLIDEGYNQGNTAVIDEQFSPDYVHHSLPPGMPHDREGCKQMVKMLHTAFPDYRITTEDVVAEGDNVVPRFHWSGTHKGEFIGIAPTGKKVTVTAMSIHHIQGGKEVEQWGELDRLGMLRQLGVVPPPEQ